MYVCHALNSVEIDFTRVGKSPTYRIFTSSASINMVLKLYCTLFHSHESFIWALIGVMTYYRIMSLVTSKPSLLNLLNVFLDILEDDLSASDCFKCSYCGHPMYLCYRRETIM